MKYQTPAEGIFLRNNSANTTNFSVMCSCGSDDHCHNIWVETNEGDISVTIYSLEHTKYINDTNSLFGYYWNILKNKLLLTKRIWFDGYIESESEIILNKQTALNYAETLKNAIEKLNV